MSSVQDTGPETFQQFPSNRIIVIHPGSFYVRIGRASDLLPVRQLHCIARKRRPEGIKTTKIQNRQPSDPEDPFDAEFLRETGRKKEVVDSAVAEQQTETANEAQPSTNTEEDIVVDTLEGGPGDIVTLAPGQVLSLDAAILQSIDRCPNEELKRKMYSSILIIGGGVKVHGLNLWLQNRLALQIPYAYKTEQLEIVTSPKDIDPASTVWKGAAVMSCLESAIELWINQSEWNKHGLKVLRERAPFIW
ncbi:actin-related protein 8 [Pieris brassicae]|uniref:actin-related protein 8 n=1 Tax=Pieris brassicae TaxID=7116 RepID=UPI001E66079C|nr:actin-related protein 8 [Pieris brassicae]